MVHTQATVYDSLSGSVMWPGKNEWKSAANYAKCDYREISATVANRWYFRRYVNEPFFQFFPCFSSTCTATSYIFSNRLHRQENVASRIRLVLLPSLKDIQKIFSWLRESLRFYFLLFLSSFLYKIWLHRILHLMSSRNQERSDI